MQKEIEKRDRARMNEENFLDYKYSKHTSKVTRLPISSDTRCKFRMSLKIKTKLNSLIYSAIDNI